MEKSTKKRVRNVVLGMTSVALVAGITASLTLAYLTDTATVDNVFSNNPSITAKLIEPAWDADSDGDHNEETVDTNDALYSASTTYGLTQASDYTVGTAINKDPKIKNTSATAEYAAISIEYQVDLTGAGTYTTVTADDFAQIATVNFTGSWAKMTKTDASDKKEYYILGATDNPTFVAAGAISADLFTTVTVNTPPAEAVTLSSGETLSLSSTYTLPKFKIVLNGAVIDTANESGENTTAAAKLLSLLESNT